MWNNGNWYNKNQKYFLYIVDGENVETKPMIYVDYPEIIKPFMNGSWIFGDFGPADPEIVKHTGIQNYNLLMDYTIVKFKGVLNEEGTQLQCMGVIPGMIYHVGRGDSWWKIVMSKTVELSLAAVALELTF